MFSYILSLLLLLLSNLLISSLRSFDYLPVKELHRRFLKNDPLAKKIYPAIKYKKQIETFVTLKVIVLSSISLVLLVKNVSLIFSLISIVSLFLLTSFILKTNGRKTNLFIVRLGGLFFPAYVRLFNWLQSKLKLKFSLEVTRNNQHTGLFDLDDIEDLVTKQLKQNDNRILEQDLVRLKKILMVDNTSIKELYVPKEHFPIVRLNDAITPVIIDEIHKSYQDGIPVYDDNDKIIGLIGKQRLGLNTSGYIRDYTDFSNISADLKESIVSVIKKLYQNDLSVLLVYDNQVVVGTITSVNIFKWLFSLDHQSIDNNL